MSTNDHVSYILKVIDRDPHPLKQQIKHETNLHRFILLLLEFVEIHPSCSVFFHIDHFQKNIAQLFCFYQNRVLTTDEIFLLQYSCILLKSNVCFLSHRFKEN